MPEEVATPMHKMMKKITFPLLVLVAMLAFAGVAEARTNVRVGIGDQQAGMFAQPAFQALKIKRVRYFVRWDAMRRSGDRLAARTYVQTARRNGASVLLHISSDNLTRKKARLPSKSRYRRDVTRLVKYFKRLGVREFGARNEANHDSQATWKSPSRAAYEFRTVRRACGSKCTIVALDVLDQRGVERYIRRFYSALGSYRRFARIVGIHNYSDINRKRTRGTRSIIRTVERYNRRTQFWLTETGGVVNFGSSFPYNESRAANRLSYLFTVAKRYRRDIKRLYVYNWTGAPRGARFDAGVTNADGSPRPGYNTLRSRLRDFLR
jgi:hypothetical protein